MFQLPELPYAYDALAPKISADIMHLHHDKHHQAYIDKLNAALDGIPEVNGQTIEEILTSLDTLPEPVRVAVRNNGGGHYNHSLFWQWLSPEGGGEPSEELADKLAQRYGSFQAFVDEFTAKATSVFGSGWTWLMPNMDIITTPNQDNPIIEGKPTPILGLDVWEHAYYLDYKNPRPEYIKAWWDVVNWEYITKCYQETS